MYGCLPACLFFITVQEFTLQCTSYACAPGSKLQVDFGCSLIHKGLLGQIGLHVLIWQIFIPDTLPD